MTIKYQLIYEILVAFGFGRNNEGTNERALQNKEQNKQTKHAMQNLSAKHGQQLVVLAEDISLLGKIIVGERNHAQFEYRKLDPERPNECFEAARALLAKAEYYACAAEGNMGSSKS